jgi:hypothetical protein
MPITDPYTLSKQKNYRPTLITAEKVRLEEARLRKVVAPAPADTGQYCKTCSRELHGYDVERKECFTHGLDRIRSARNTRL